MATLSLEDVKSILVACLKKYKKTTDVPYSDILVESGLYRSKLQYWKKEEEVVNLIEKFDSIRLSRYEKALFKPENSKLSTNLIWYGKACMGMMEEYNKQRLAIDNREVDLHEKEISIGFED